jgi:hypothetical protein
MNQIGNENWDRLVLRPSRIVRLAPRRRIFKQPTDQHWRCRANLARKIIVDRLRHPTTCKNGGQRGHLNYWGKDSKEVL